MLFHNNISRKTPSNVKLANIFTIIVCRIINATCRCIDRGCEAAEKREKSYYHHNLCSIFSKNNTKDDGRKETKKKTMTQTIFHNFGIFSMMCIH